MKVIPKNKKQAPVETKKAEVGIKLTEPAVSIGNRGTATILAKTLPAGVVFGENPQLPKSGHDEATAPWLIVRAWISSRPHPFTVQPVSVAIKRGLVKLVKGVQIVHKQTGKRFTADALLPKGWQPNQKVPQNVAVINTKWPGGRVESKLVNENRKADGTRPAPRNAAYVGSIEFKAA